MTNKPLEDFFTQAFLDKLFPDDRADNFFEALYGEAAESVYDIRLAFKQHHQRTLEFEFQLKQRPGKCLACNLTYGLPQVFSRHPIININGLVKKIEGRLNGQAYCSGWQLGNTREISRQLHIIPFTITLDG